MSSYYDIIIIGSGAGGGTMALALAPTGKRILLLERGSYLRREQDNWDPDAVFVRGKYQAKETWYDREGRTFHPGLHYFVGGNTKVYGGALFRLRPQDFEEIVHADGLSPAWPVGYAEFEPITPPPSACSACMACAGLTPQRAGRVRPTPPACPPRAAHPGAVRRLGTRRPPPFPQPLAILLEEDANGHVAQHSSCIRCSAYGWLSLPYQRQGRRADHLRRSGTRLQECHAHDGRLRRSSRNRRARAHGHRRACPPRR